MIGFAAEESVVESVRYVSRTNARGSRVDSMKFVLTDGEAVYANNDGYHADNNALCVLAFLGGRPSRLDDVEGETLPYVYNANGVAKPPRFVVSNGRAMLEQSDWFASTRVDE